MSLELQTAFAVMAVAEGGTKHDKVTYFDMVSESRNSEVIIDVYC
jgi:hypothetical protein